jgi:hypothetical protein
MFCLSITSHIRRLCYITCFYRKCLHKLRLIYVDFRFPDFQCMWNSSCVGERTSRLGYREVSVGPWLQKRKHSVVSLILVFMDTLAPGVEGTPILLKNVSRDNIVTDLQWDIIPSLRLWVHYQVQFRVKCAGQDDSISWIRNLLTVSTSSKRGQPATAPPGALLWHLETSIRIYDVL